MSITLSLIITPRINAFPFLFDRHRLFFAQTVDNLEKIIGYGDFGNPLLSKYTIDNNIFILRLDIHDGNIGKEDIKKDLANSYYIFEIYTKDQREIICTIKNMRLVTSTYNEDISNLIYYRNSASSDKTSKFRTTKYPFYKEASIIGGAFNYIRPKDMKFSIEIDIEVEENKIITSHKLIYDYNLTMKDRWITLLD
jgi:hypothetical protein